MCGCIHQQDLSEIEGPPAIPPPKQVTSAEITAGTETKLRSYSPANVKAFVDTHGVSGIVEDDVYSSGWNADTTHSPSQNAVYDRIHLYDTDDDGDIDNIDGAVGGGDITGVGPAGTAAGDALTDGYATSGATLFVFEGTTVDTNEITIAMPSADPAADVTLTFPDQTGTMIVGPGAGLTDNTIPRVDGSTSHLLQASGITIDDSNNLASVGTISSGAITSTGTSTFGDAASPDAADGATLGSAAAEWSDLFLADGGVIYGQADQSNSITSSATDWTFALDVVITGSDLTLGAAGVKLTGDGDGAITLLGLGDGFDENLIINLDDTSNTAVISSTTGVTGLTLTSIGITTGAASDLSAGAVTLGTVAGTITDGTASWNTSTQALAGFSTITGTGAVTGATVTDGTITLAGDGTITGLAEGGLPNSTIVTADVKDNDLTASDLSATLTFADGDIIDLSGVTHTAATDEGFVLPNWANVVPTSDKKFLAADGSNLKLYNGGWVTIGASAAPTDATYLTLALDATLSAERVMTAGYALDFTDAGANGTLTIALDTTEVSADGTDTFSDGTQAAVAWTFDVVGTDTTLTGGNGVVGLSHPLYIGTDPADAGTIRLENAASIQFEASPAGTDVSALTVTSGEVVQIGASGASGVTITPSATLTGGIASIGAASDLSGGSVTLGTVVGTITMATATDVTYLDGTVDPADLADADFGFFTVASGVASIDDGTVAAADLADADFGDFTVSSGSATLDADVVAAAEMADADHGDVSWTSGVATVEDFTLTGDASVPDDLAIIFGTGSDWDVSYDELTDNRLEFVHAAGADADVYFDLNDNAADSTYTITNSDGTYEANLSVEGDITAGGSFTVTGDGSSYVTFSNNTSYAGSGYQIFPEGGQFKVVENGTEKILLDDTDSATPTGSTWDFSGVTNFLLPSAVADAANEMSISTGNQLKWHDGAKVVTIDTTVTNDNYVLKYDNATATFNLEADATGGTPSIDTVTDATADATIAFDAGEEMSWQYTGAYTTGTQFLVQQQTGNPTGGVLFEARAADSDTTPFKAGDGTNAWTVSTAGLLTNAGTATLNLAAASDLTVGGGQIDYDDMAGSGAISTSSTAATGVLTVTGVINTSVGLDAVGAVDMDYGSADVTDHTFITDGTGDAEIVLPDDSIGPAEMAAGVYDLGTSLEADTLTEGGVGVPNVNDNLSVFAATTSAQLYGVISNETGSATGTPLLVFNQAPQIDNIELGHATDTTIARSGAGTVTIEGNTVLTDTDIDITTRCVHIDIPL
jgi:hypothetical protein